MRITYDISYEEFAALQPPFPAKPQNSWLYRVALGFSAIVALAGCIPLLSSVRGASGDLAFPIEFALSFLLLGSAGGGVSYWLNRRGQAKLEQARQRHCEGVRTAYRHLHCRDQRAIEVSEGGFTLSCRCGQVTRPWTELVSFSENNFMLGLRTKSEFVLVSKRGFSSPGEITEFRALVLDGLGQREKPTVPYVDFAYTRDDFTRAQLLHIAQGGGWKPLVWRAIVISAISYLALSAAFAGDRAHYGALPWYTIPALLGFWATALLVLMLNKVRSAKHYLGRSRVWIGEDGISLRDETTETRIGWENYIGYLEDSDVYLLYHNPRFYRIFPKRIFDERHEQEFRQLLTSKLRPLGQPVAPQPPRPPNHLPGGSINPSK
jgi:hypothetical protein